MTKITGQTLIDWGFSPGPWFPEAIEIAEEARLMHKPSAEIFEMVSSLAPPPPIPLRAAGGLEYHRNITPEGDDEVANVASVDATMQELMRTPTIKAGAVMPDACPAGHVGEIPVGGVVAAENAIHPGMHSADICCSVAVSIFEETDPTKLLDLGMKMTHFGGGGRPRGAQLRPTDELLGWFDSNPFLKSLTSVAIEHFATQGDGNHFFYVGRMASTGDLALVTHHGSRKLGAMLYKAGMKAAIANTKKISPETRSTNSWITADSRDGDDYWQALQIMREWTKQNHFQIHDLIRNGLAIKLKHRFWNEHNFVFRRGDGLFYHAKGATPAFDGYAHDASGWTLIPLNMAEPILIAKGRNAVNGLGFAPHGAGRNFSRGHFNRLNADRTAEDLIAEQAPGIDVRFFSGHPDVSELPGAYKNAASVRSQIAQFGLADIIDTIEPIGTIMAGDWQRDAPWRRKKTNEKTLDR